MSNNENTSFCYRCYHTWIRRSEKLPKVCPKCKSPYWNKPKKKTPKQLIVPTSDTIIKFHDEIIKKSGGELGVRDDGGIYNSISKLLNHQQKNRRDPESIGAFAINEFSKRHYFIDGNKRTAYAIAKIFMLINRCHLKIKYGEATKFIMEVAKYKSKIDFIEIKNWLKERCEIIDEKELENYLSRSFFDVVFDDYGNGKE